MKIAFHSGTPAIVPAPTTPNPEAANVARILKIMFCICAMLKYLYLVLPKAASPGFNQRRITGATAATPAAAIAFGS
jgi:hypothetical protein